MRRIIIITRKITFIISLVLLIAIACLIPGYKLVELIDANNISVANPTYFIPHEPAEGSLEEIYQDVFMVFLDPYIEKAVEDYYGIPYAVAPYMTKVLSIERPNRGRTFAFLIKLEILPYTGPHNTVGKDHITIRVQAGPEVKVEKFEHIKDF